MVEFQEASRWKVLKTITLNLKTPVYSYNSKAYLGHLVKALAQRTNAFLYLAAGREKGEWSEGRIVSEVLCLHP